MVTVSGSADPLSPLLLQVWRSMDDGDTWIDETDDLVTLSVNSGTWFGEDFYLTTSGEGILVKRKFESAPAAMVV